LEVELKKIHSFVTGVALFGSLSLLSVPAAAQGRGAQRGGPDYLGGCVAGTPDPPPANAGAGRGGAGRGGAQAAGRGRAGRGCRGAQAEPAAAPRLPDNKEAYGVNAGKPDFGGLAKGMWNVPYIVNMATQGTNPDGTSPILSLVTHKP
jgi:hypothetical protein